MALLTLGMTGLGSGCGRQPSGEELPQPPSQAYEDVSRHFFLGLARLQVGRLDAAVEDFQRGTELAAGEPAVWANLGLAHLRLSEFDAAAPAIERAVELAPESAEIAYLQGRFETTRGNVDAGVAALRRAVELNPEHLRALSALRRELETSGDEAGAEQLMEELTQLHPDNVALLVDRARLAAKQEQGEVLADSVRRLAAFVDRWPVDVVDQFRQVEVAASSEDFAATGRSLAFLRNVLVQVPSFLEDLRRGNPSDDLIAEPLSEFVRLPTPAADPAPADTELVFALELVDRPTDGAMLAVSLDGESGPTLVTSDGGEVWIADSGAVLSLPETAREVVALAALDWNYDFRLDLAVATGAGVRLFLQQEDGSFVDVTDEAGEQASGSRPTTGVWPADVEMDGDLDLVVAVADAAPAVLRNNGDGTWQTTRPFPDIVGLRDFAWGDLDADGDPDAAMVDSEGFVRVFANLQGGRFEELSPPDVGADLAALALADVSGDGVPDLVTVHGDTVRLASLQAGEWRQSAAATLPSPSEAPVTEISIADLDNNGALDVVAATAETTSVLLADVDYSFVPLPETIAARVAAAADLDGDGTLDLVGDRDGRAVRLLGRGTRGYHSHTVRPRAVERAGDQRINSFGIGGTIEVRSGRLVQKQTISGPRSHFGLGEHERVDVTRIVWPNGVPQAEFDAAADGVLVAEQRLKGSCPWVFADAGEGLEFVTDFLWRSPLGLKINAQDTAGVLQTEDRVRIRGDQLAARDGAYDIRITAELWETHFIDHVSLLVVDHPRDSEVFVDERFRPGAVPSLEVIATGAPRPLASARDHNGRDVLDLVRKADGRTVDAFELGQYQGVGREHFVEIELGDGLTAATAGHLIGRGWVYPTDSSINVAMGQGGEVIPRSLSLEAQTADGEWMPVASDLGFPAGKHKTVVVDLAPAVDAGLGEARRLRLITNLEVYWDWLATVETLPETELQQIRLAPTTAELGYRGFSVTAGGRRVPEIPRYNRIATTTPLWRDLEGFYTRYGDVRELLTEIEDRYVIMNAGDELRFTFAAPPDPPAGWRRDFVLIGDGWVKDGDFNTGYSKTVVPLPTHARSDYTAASTQPTLAEDPVYQRHRDDWVEFHTRYVAPDPFLEGLALAGLGG